jgi:hypothetical protein
MKENTVPGLTFYYYLTVYGPLGFICSLNNEYSYFKEYFDS